MILAS